MTQRSLCGVRRQRFSVLLCLGRLRGRYGTIDKGPQVGRYASALRRSFYQVSNKHFIYIYISLSLLNILKLTETNLQKDRVELCDVVPYN